LKTDVREQGETTDTLDYASVITRDLKTSLTAIIASADILSQELHPDENSVRWTLIQSIVRNDHHINERISAHETIIRPGADDFQPNPEPVNVRKVLDTIAAMLHPQIKEHGQTFTIRCKESVPPAWVDSLHLEQIVTTLISTASSSSLPGGRISVNVEIFDNKSIIIEVNDNGKNMPVKEQDKTVQPYSRNSSNNIGNRRERGLAIIQLLVNLNKGNLWLKNKNGYGTSFFFTLPISGGLK